MAQRTGALVFDERTDRYDIRFDLNTYYGGLHELSAMLSGGGIPGMEAAPGYPAEPADHDTEEMEDTENE